MATWQSDLDMPWSAADFTWASLESGGTIIWPDPSNVADGVQYGPTGVEYTGTLVGGGISQAQMDELLIAIGNVPIPTLSGPNTVTISVVDQDTSAPLEGALVKLYRVGGVQETKPTDASGEAVFTVVDATWQIGVTEGMHVGAAGVIAVPTELSKTIQLATIFSPPSTDPSKSNVKTRVIDQKGRPIVGATVSADVKGQEFAEGSLVINRSSDVATNSNGEAFIELVRSVNISGDGMYEFVVCYKGVEYRFEHFVRDQPTDTATLRFP